MKKVFRLVLLSFIIFLCSGCNGTVTRSIRHAGFNLSANEFVCKELLPQNENDINYLKIRYFMDNVAITEDGSIYEISLDKKFSNNENCRKAATNLSVVSIFNSVFKSNDGNYYYLAGSNNNLAYSAISNTDSNYNLYKLLLDDSNVVKVQLVNNTYYVLKTDGNIYNYTISKIQDNNYVIDSNNLIYDKSNYGGNIIDFNYAGESLNTFIKTTDKVYRMRVTNGDTCNKYVDITCKFELKEDEVFATYKDKILTYNGSMIITTYGKEFTVVS